MKLWPFGGTTKPPSYSDDALAGLAAMYTDCPDDPTPFLEVLDTSRCDYSTSSLAAVDEHLESVRGHYPDDAALIKVVLRSGAYVGEVIRRNAIDTRTWHWLDYDNAARINPQVKSFGKQLGSTAVLWNGDKFCFPLAKALKRIQNGNDDSVRTFAEVVIAGPSD